MRKCKGKCEIGMHERVRHTCELKGTCTEIISKAGATGMTGREKDVWSIFGRDAV